MTSKITDVRGMVYPWDTSYPLGTPRPWDFSYPEGMHSIPCPWGSSHQKPRIDWCHLSCFVVSSITVKPCWMGLKSRWVTIWIISLCCTPWEVRLAKWTSITPSTSTTNVVCGLSFSRSQPDFEGFRRALRFPPCSKLDFICLSMGIWCPSYPLLPSR